jgi:hypothetical protein
LFLGWAIGIAWLSVSISFGNIICSVAYALQICYVKSPPGMYHGHHSDFTHRERWERRDALDVSWPAVKGCLHCKWLGFRSPSAPIGANGAPIGANGALIGVNGVPDLKVGNEGK